MTVLFAVAKPTQINKPISINGLGDSISARGGQYQQPGAYNAPQWLPNTAYVVGNLVVNNNLIYRCTTGGTSAGAGGPTGLGSGIVDGTAQWLQLRPNIVLGSESYLNWAEKYSNGQLYVNQQEGITGITGSLVKIIVINGGQNYLPSDTIAVSGSGVSVSPVVVNGVITAVNILNPGQPTSTGFSASITTSTGTGAVLSGVQIPSGTFGVGGCLTRDMVARLPDVLASKTDIVVVHGGTNDLTASVDSSTIIANLQLCYESLIKAGKRVIAVPIQPRTGLTGIQIAALHRVNNWIQNYCQAHLSINPLNKAIDIADPSGYWTDGSSATGLPVGGGSGTVAYAVTGDGLHQSPRGAQYFGYTVWVAAQRLIGGSTPLYPVRRYSQTDGYDPVRNPAGNMLEGAPWTLSTAYAVGAIVSNDTAPVKTYRCTVAGTTAGAGGPTGTGGSIADGTVTWAYIRPAGTSTGNCGNAGTGTAAGGIVFVGNIPTGTAFARSAGTAAGTITFSSESPWSNGQVGQRPVFAFSLGAGAADEVWNYTINNTAFANLGIVAGDLLTSYLYAEVEVELSNIANLAYCGIEFQDSASSFLCQDMTNSAIGSARLMLASSGEMIAYPNGGKILLKTNPILIPAGLSNVTLQLRFAFQCAGGAGSATTTAKINYAAIRKAYVT
jgi:hypothetical protein